MKSTKKNLVSLKLCLRPSIMIVIAASPETASTFQYNWKEQNLGDYYTITCQLTQEIFTIKVSEIILVSVTDAREVTVLADQTEQRYIQAGLQVHPGTTPAYFINSGQ